MSPPISSPRRSRLLVLALSGTLSFAAPVRSQSAPAVQNEARSHYHRGVELFTRARFNQALAEFQTSLGLYDSPNTRLLVARSLRELGRLSEAVVEFETSARDAATLAPTEPRFAATRDAAEQEGLGLETMIARVAVDVPGAPADLVVRVGGREVRADFAASGVPVMPGAVEVDITSEQVRPRHRDVTVGAGQRVHVAFEWSEPVPIVERAVTDHPVHTLPAETTPPATDAPPTVARDLRRATTVPSRAAHRGAPVVPAPAAWTALSVGVASGGAFGVLFGVTSQEYASAAGRCAPRCSDADLATGHSLETVTNVALVVGIAALAVSAVLLPLSRIERRTSGSRVGCGSLGVFATF